MFTHVMIGSNDLERSRRFFDATFAALGGNAGEMDARGRLIYVHEGSRLMITKPIDGKPATAANGGTIGILAAIPNRCPRGMRQAPSMAARRSRPRLRSVRTVHSLPIFAIPMGTNSP